MASAYALLEKTITRYMLTLAIYFHSGGRQKRPISACKIWGAGGAVVRGALPNVAEVLAAVHARARGARADHGAAPRNLPTLEIFNPI